MPFIEKEIRNTLLKTDVASEANSNSEPAFFTFLNNSSILLIYPNLKSYKNDLH